MDAHNYTGALRMHNIYTALYLLIYLIYFLTKDFIRTLKTAKQRISIIHSKLNIWPTSTYISTYLATVKPFQLVLVAIDLFFFPW